MIKNKLEELIEETVKQISMFESPLIVLPVLIDCYIKLRDAQTRW